MGAEHVELRSDSQVIVRHIKGEFEAKGEKMKLYLSRVQDMQASLKQFSIVKIPREQNDEADLLAWMGSGTTKDSERKVSVPIQVLVQSIVFKDAIISVLEVIPPWADESVSYLQKGDLPIDKRAVVKLKVKAAQFTLINNTLYKRGFYWPNMSRDSMRIVKTCDKCQRFANVSQRPLEDLSSISSPWPFSQ
jgi:ribonuclease HI